MAQRDRLVRQALRREFVVTLTSGATFAGVLLDADDRTVVLTRAATISVTPRNETVRTAVDGQLFLPRDEVEYMQAIAP